MIWRYVDRWGQYNYAKVAERLLECNWKLAELNRDYLTRDEMNRYKLVIKVLGRLEKEDLRALAVRYYKPNKYRSHGKIIPTTYSKTAEILGTNLSQCHAVIDGALRRFGELFIQYWEEEGN